MRTKEDNIISVRKWRDKNRHLNNKRQKEYNKKWIESGGRTFEMIKNRKEYIKKWNQRNKDRTRKYCRERKVKKLNAKGFHTIGEWNLLKKQYGYCCPSCHKIEPEVILTEDHIVPLSKGGSDFIENIQPLCRSCNCRKYTKIIKYLSPM